MKLIIKAAIQIQKPVEEVFDAIVNPGKMKQYFISEGSGRLEEGKDIFWKWPEFPDHESIVNQIKIEQNKSITFVWDNQTTVKITLEEQADESVVVRVTEGDKELSEDNLKWYGGNSEGWANFLACMKAYLEYNINLRKGAFEFLRNSIT
ncbi:MAG TPA: SRPBCC domain-containing protein [Saprospiraceae bacterium]|nr:SRPBCC domain-containing protein [Saprospiraceae bacterium]